MSNDDEQDEADNSGDEKLIRNVANKKQVLWWVDKSKVQKKLAKIQIALKSLKADEIKQVKEHINQAFKLYHDVQEEESNGAQKDYNRDIPELHFQEEVLTKATLRGYNLTDQNSDIVILVHKCEGRIFLTDRNGIFHDLLADSWIKKKGNVMILLTGNRTKVEADELINADVEKLATQGDQPTVKLF